MPSPILTSQHESILEIALNRPEAYNAFDLDMMVMLGDALALLGIGVFGGIAQILLTDSYRHAPASVVAPFSYTSMIWAVVLGYFIFNELPDAIVLVGAAIVVGAGLFVIFRERALGINRQKEKEAATPPAGPPVE